MSTGADPTVLSRRSVGFDLDMTLVDSAAATAYAVDRVNRLLCLHIDVEATVHALGSPLREELARTVAADRLGPALKVFAHAFLAGGLSRLSPMPAAAETLAALRDRGWRPVVVTARRADIAQACLRTTGLTVSEVVAGRPSATKADALRDGRIACYVGDHPFDMQAARGAGVPGIGVTTGFHDGAALAAAGASVVLAGLGGLLPSLARWAPGTSLGGDG